MEEKPSSSENLEEETEKIDNRIDHIYNIIYNLYPKEDRRGHPVSPKESPIVIIYKFRSYYLAFCIDAKGNIKKHKNSDNLTTYYLEFIRFTPSDDMTRDYYWSLYTKDKETGEYTEYTNAAGTLEKQVYTQGEWEHLDNHPYTTSKGNAGNWPMNPKSPLREEDITFINEILDRVEKEIAT